MNGSMNIHWAKYVTVGPLEKCGDNGRTIFRVIVVETEDGQKFELNVFGNAILNIKMENTNEQ